MNMFLLNILLAVMWGMATGMFSVPNLAFGFALGYLILRFSQRVLGPSAYFAKVPLLLRFALRYLWDLFLANLRVAYDVLVPGAWPSPATGRRRVAPLGPSPRGAGPPAVPAPAFPDSLRAPLAAESYVCPGVVAIPLDARTDAEIVLLANLITLTPGSVSLDLSEDRRVLYVHAMYIDGGDVEAYRRAVKEGLERRVLELLR
jgi:multicomponent Na+:H+ antiporter subunit E